MWKSFVAVAIMGSFVSASVALSARQNTPTVPDFAGGAAPATLMCSEETAEIKETASVAGERHHDLLESYMLVSDPNWTCRHPDVASAAGYERTGQRCYQMRSIGTGAPDVPLACVEAFDGDPEQGAGVAALRCSGFDHRVAATAEGSFHLSLRLDDGSQVRLSNGSCHAF